MTDRAARLVYVALIVAVAVGGVATVPGASGQSLDTIADTQINPDDVSLNVDIGANGSAAWTVEYRVRLDDENTTEAFESLRGDIETNESRYADEFGGRMAATAATAENATGREMRIENVSVAATRQQLPQDYGVVTYSFVWTNFAAVDDGEIRAGDALAGFFLDEETSLRFSWPDGYALDTAQPQPADTRLESRIVVWAGPLEFGQNEPVLVVVEQPPDAGDGTTSVGGDGDAGDGSAGDDGASDDGRTNDGIGSGALLALGAVLVVAAGAGGWFAYRRYGERDADRGGASRDGVVAAGTGAGETEPDRPGRGADRGESGGGADGGGEADSGGDSDGMDSIGSGDESGSSGSGEEADESEGSGDGADDTEGDADDTAVGAAGADDSEADVRPWEDELLSNEERVLALVEHEGGRMKQQEVAQTLEWTDAKTSQVVRKMREADKLDAFRLGRENVLVLPGEEFGPGENR